MLDETFANERRQDAARRALRQSGGIREIG
jgi:hypothetical protein